MPKRANTNVQSSNAGSSAANNDGRRKLRRLVAAPNISGTHAQPSTFSATTARQPASSSGTTAAQLYQNGAALLQSFRHDVISSLPVKPLLPIYHKMQFISPISKHGRLPWFDSTEASNGQRFGSLNLNTDYPRIPSKKFKAHQAPKAKSKAANKKWSVQAVYKDQNNEWKVSFEGWSPDSTDTYDVTMVDKAYIEKRIIKITSSLVPKKENMDRIVLLFDRKNYWCVCEFMQFSEHN